MGAQHLCLDRMTPDQQFWIGFAVQLFVAIATLFLAVAAIWGDKLRAHFVGPRLQLRLLDARGERQMTNNGAARYYHLRVTNSRRFAPANNVRVVLTGLARPDATGAFQWRWLSGPLQFTWQHADSIAQFPRVGPPQNADLGHVMQQGGFDLSLTSRPIGFGTYLMGMQQQMIIEARAQSDEAESPPIRVKIAWNGQWSDDTLEMAGHLMLEVVAVEAD
jgi:hypothetical protein